MSNKSNTDWLEPTNRFRATPIDLLRQGLTRKQWEAVEACYTMLTGEKIVEATPAPAPSPAEPEIEEEDDFPGSVGGGGHRDEPDEDEDEDEDESDESDEDDDDDEEDGMAKPAKKKNAESRVYGRTEPISTKKRVNLFEDDGITAAEDKALMPKEENLIKLPRGQRRPTYQKIKVTCRKCGTREMVDPFLGPRALDKTYKTKYVCNSCSCEGGNE